MNAAIVPVGPEGEMSGRVSWFCQVGRRGGRRAAVQARR